MKLQVAGENSLILYLGKDADEATSARVQAAVATIEMTLGDRLLDLVPSYASILILFDLQSVDHMTVMKTLHKALAEPTTRAAGKGRTITLPVYYSRETGIDLEPLAARASLSVEQVIELHANTGYRVFAIGFAPGFAYLGQVDPRIAAPRLRTPRQRVPRGSVAIADRQTAVYPSESPGGWNLVGRCPVSLFNPAQDPAMPIAVGDEVYFEPISRAQFLSLGGDLG
ncbi:5-oxoprolinase subunit PxpB [Candidatus Marimicrobium litorale]|uniref:5-oxoprolinase subunit PxpB n=1 Tax=Candidatus Marimicrobium litorale TaxID=2518991 RepID=A0ABT3T1F4_9GAMM|nr:5-oxoprolinase subunit PxpB [Candidatus Marimicrobium litorale]MCX2976092.1 5-oxoprolinase subunit PxpB [Candidatus Marimicrobium litorale]